MVKGRCLCGGVSFEVKGDVTPIIFCHCKQCRSWHGNFVGYTGCRQEDLVFHSEETLAWYVSSDVARRGFCKTCGSSLFWDRLASKAIAVAGGCLDDPTELTAKEHIFTEFAADYYQIKDGLPQLVGDHEDGV